MVNRHNRLLIFLFIILSCFLVQAQRINQENPCLSFDRLFENSEEDLFLLNNAIISASTGALCPLDEENYEKEIINLLTKRMMLLQEKIKIYPDIVFSLDPLPISVSSYLSEKQKEKLLEQKIKFEGTLEVIHNDDFIEIEKSEFVFYVSIDNNVYSLLSTHSLPVIKSGNIIEGEGIKIGKFIVTDNSNLNVKKKNTQNALTTITGSVTGEEVVEENIGEQKTLVVLVNIDQFAAPMDFEQANEFVFGEQYNSLNDFYIKDSYEKAFFSGEVLGPYTFSIQDCVPTETTSELHIRDLALASAKNDLISSGKELTDYNRLIIFVPSECISTNRGDLGIPEFVLSSGESLRMSTSWINQGNHLKITAHELGHNFGIHHGNSYECFTSQGVLTSFSYDCDTYEYGDIQSLMSAASTLPVYNNAPHKKEIGWLEEENVVIATEGTYELRPLGVVQLAGQIQMIQIPITLDTSFYYSPIHEMYYTIELRKKIDYDENLGFPGGVSYDGVSIRLASFNDILNYQTNVFVLERNENGRARISLNIGESFIDDLNGYSIRLNSITGESENAVASVSIERIPTREFSINEPIIDYDFSSLAEEQRRLIDKAGIIRGGIISRGSESSPELIGGSIVFHEDSATDERFHETVYIRNILPFFSIMQNNQFTLSLWVNLNEAPLERFESVITKVGPSLRLSILPGRKIKLTLPIEVINEQGLILFEEQEVISNNRINLNQWHNVIATFNGAEVVLYIDGIEDLRFLLNQDDKLGGLNLAYDRFRTHSHLGGLFEGYGLNGMIDEFKIYARALSSEEVVNLYHSFIPTQNFKFIRGDANNNNQVDISDAIFLLEYLFKNGEEPYCLDSADANDDGVVDISDPIKILFVLFSGHLMPSPFPELGRDTTADNFPCGDAVYMCPENLAAYWKFDEGVSMIEQNLILDSSGNQINGHFDTDNFEAPLSPEWISNDAIRGSSLNFESNDHEIFFPDNPLFDLGDEDLSISLWVKPNQIEEIQNILKKEIWFDSRFYKYYFRKTTTGFNFAIDRTNVPISLVSSGNIILTQNWYHLVAVRNTADRTISLYINGEKVGETQDVLIGDGVVIRAFKIGSSDTTRQGAELVIIPRFTGKIDEVAIYREALTDLEISEIYNNGLGNELCGFS